MLNRRQLLETAAGTTLTLASLSTGRAALADSSQLRVVPFSEPTIFDPVVTGFYSTTNAALMIYDTLFSWDANMTARPQMVQAWERSDDGLTYRFMLRPGLRFHDGTEVTTRDVMASLRRMLLGDTTNQLLASYVAGMNRIDDRTFVLRLHEPFAFVEFLLGGSNNISGAIMREKEAETAPSTPVRTLIGSGPFRFLPDEYEPGARIVWERFDGYMPRPDPPSGFAGGKVVKVKRVEWVVMPDPEVGYEALRTNEVDLLDSPSIDLIPTVENNPDIVIRQLWPIDGQTVLRFNWLWPPFNSLKARQAVAHALSQTNEMEAAIGDPHYWRICRAFWICGSPNGTEAGSENYKSPDFDLARRLLAESGYSGEKVVMIGASNVPMFRQMCLVTAQTLGRIGMKVDLQLSDTATFVARRIKKDPPSAGGWNMFHTMATGAASESPLISPSTVTTCDGKNFPGWPCDAAEESLRRAYVSETDPARRQDLLAEMHRRLWAIIPYVPLGQVRQPYVWRRNVHGVLNANNLVFWNIEKT
jgi:peptide/nickel transport system substrate-binding protein